MNKKLTEKLNALSDKKYSDFHSGLVPGLGKEKIIGVRIPILRKLYKELTAAEKKEILNTLPHEFYEEYILHSIIISDMKNFDECKKELDKFLPYVDNWAVCDSIRPKILTEDREKFMEFTEKLISSGLVYTARFGIEMLMTYFLDDYFKTEYLYMPLVVDTKEYYLSMMVAWFYATALGKHYEETLEFLEKGKLDDETMNRTVKKAIESFRISDDRKKYLRTLKRI